MDLAQLNLYMDGWSDQLDHLKDAIDDWVLEESPDLSNLYFMIPSGLAIPLNNFVVPNLEPLAEVTVTVGTVSFGVSVTLLRTIAALAAPGVNLLIELGDSIKMPGSEYWYFRRNGEGPQQGCEFGDPEDPDTWEYYTLKDIVVDYVTIRIVLWIMRKLHSMGLFKLLYYYAKRAFLYGKGIWSWFRNNQRWSDLFDDTDDLQDGQDAIDLALAVVDQQVDDIKVNTIDIESKVDTVDTVVDVISANVVTIDSKIDNLDSDNDTVIEALTTLLAEFIDDDNTLEETVNQIKTIVTSGPALP